MANTYNFNAGPGALPAEVLQEAQEELRNYQEIGASILEISHRRITSYNVCYTKLLR